MPRSETQGRVRLGEALAAVEASPERLATLFQHGTLEVEFYAPRARIRRSRMSATKYTSSHAGPEFFRCHGRREPFGPGDLLFAPAGMEHGFEEFNEDSGACVLFYGPKGGEPA